MKKRSIAHLGPVGTYSETAALAYSKWLAEHEGISTILCPQPSIALVFKSVLEKQVDWGVVPVENSIEGSVVVTLDTLWQNSALKISKGFVLPITHSLLSFSDRLEDIRVVYSHPQALGQCQKWLENNLPQVQLIPTLSTTEALKYLKEDLSSSAIASERAASIYNIPVVASSINDRPDNCTRFLVVGLNGNNVGNYLSLAFSLPKNVPGALVKPLQIFAQRNINLSKIESRPSKRSLGEYIFLIDLEGNLEDIKIKSALKELAEYTDILNIFGNYNLISVEDLLDISNNR